MKIKEESTIEEIIEFMPESIQYFQTKGIRCIACGEPIWGTLKEAVKEKNMSEAELANIIDELNELASSNR